MELHVFQYLVVMESNKNQRRVEIILNFTKGEIYFISFNDKVFLRVISRCSPLFAPSIKGLSLLCFGQKENIPKH